MEEEDILIIMADHGNDPTIGHSNHTREYVPLMIAGHKVKAANIGRRNSMADVGATLSEFFGLPQMKKGRVFTKRFCSRMNGLEFHGNKKEGFLGK